MKRIIVLCMFLVATFSVAQNRMSVSFTDSSVVIKIKGKVTTPGFAPDMHHPFELQFKKIGNVYEALLPDVDRKTLAGKLGASVIYQISTGVFPAKLDKPLKILISIPKGKDLIWGCQVWSGDKAELSFANYFQAREYPIVLVTKGKYLVRTSRFNRIDSLSVAYVYDDSLSQSSLPRAFTAVDTAALHFGLFAPTYLEKYVMRYPAGAGKKKYVLVYFITNRKIVTGSEHYNQPLIITPPSFIREDGIFHTLFHSLVGKSIIPTAYMRSSGHYCPADALGMYEGLTTYISYKHVKENFAVWLSALVYRAKLRADLKDLRVISLDFEGESYYGKGYLFWFYLEANGLNVELFSKWLFTIYLINKPFPVQFEWSDVISWLKVYDKRIGYLAEDVYQGDYLDKAFQALKDKGWKPIPVYQIPYWYDLYIGPYAVTPGGVQLPTDNYPVTTAYPAYLINQDGSKIKIEPKKDNPALMFIKAHPDSSFQIEFSDGAVKNVPNKIKFADGTPYFMHGEINVDASNIKFWQKINNHLK